MLYEAYLSVPNLQCRYHIPFDDALKNAGLYICLRNLAVIAKRRRDQKRTAERPPLELT